MQRRMRSPAAAAALQRQPLQERLLDLLRSNRQLLRSRSVGKQ